MAGGSIYNDFKKSTVIRRFALPVHAPTSSAIASHISASHCFAPQELYWWMIGVSVLSITSHSCNQAYYL
jgi:hypothetical protein